MSRDPKVLVALIGETRAAELTADAFRANLLEPLNADLALCVRAGEPPNPFHEWASHVWTFEERGDWGEAYLEAAGNSDWRVLLQVSPLLMGGIKDEEYPQVTMVAALYYYRRLLWRRMREAGIPDAYDWIVLSRSDLLWPIEHPDVRYLSERRIYVLDGEQYGGVCDRHFVIPKRYFEPVFGELVEPIFTDPVGLKRRIDEVAADEGWYQMNIEQLLAMRLRDLGLWRRVRYLPYIPFAVRPPGGSTSWSVGTFDREAGYYVKYPDERERSLIARETIQDQQSWKAHLAPLRGLSRRRRLKRAYQERGLYWRAFSWRDAFRRKRPRLISLKLGAMKARHWAEIRIGRLLRKLPGAARVLDARLRRAAAPPPPPVDEFAAESFALEGEDLILRRLLGDRADGFYVDVGAHHPRKLSKTAHFHRLGWRGINIDADPDAIAAFRQERPEDINVNCGVGGEEGEFALTRYHERALSTFDPERVALLERDAPHQKVSDSPRIPVRRLQTILDRHLDSTQAIDFISVDVEGREEQVLRSNDWSRFRPEFVAVEIETENVTDLAVQPTYAFMVEQGYECVAKTPGTTFFARRAPATNGDSGSDR